MKIDPEYKGSVVHVLDASRSVGVASSLLSKEEGKAKSYSEGIKSEYVITRENYLKRKSTKAFLSLKEAQENKWNFEWNNYTPPSPVTLDRVIETPSIELLEKYIDWTPFFTTWQLAGRYPKILDDKIVGTESRKLFEDAKAMLDKIKHQNLIQVKGVTQLFPANSQGDDVLIFRDESRTKPVVRLKFNRQQSKKAAGRPNLCLADFIAPHSSGEKDYLGAFTVTTGLGIEEPVKKFEADHDDYSAIMLKALADRLAEAFAEYLHELVRKKIWAYQSEEILTNEELISERYQGIRPAPGYPACPVHSEKRKLFDLLESETNTGVTLTESFAMYPAASVSGWYFSHPESKYFTVGEIQKDQIAAFDAR